MTWVRWRRRSTACRRVWLSGNDFRPRSAPTSTRPWRRDCSSRATTCSAVSALVADQSASRTRFSMLETIRQFAEEQLVTSGAAEAVRTAHAHYFAGREADIMTPSRLFRDVAVVRIHFSLFCSQIRSQHSNWQQVPPPWCLRTATKPRVVYGYTRRHDQPRHGVPSQRRFRLVILRDAPVAKFVQSCRPIQWSSWQASPICRLTRRSSSSILMTRSRRRRLPRGLIDVRWGSRLIPGVRAADTLAEARAAGEM
jgi:hypothetical protein